MEQKSKLLEVYKNSPFINVGNKVSAIQNNKIPNNIKIGDYNTKSILEIQKDFDEIVVKPYKTILSQHSSLGGIKINPTAPLLNLFDRINNQISPVLISTNTSLLQVTSIYSNITQIDNSDLLQYRILPSVNQSTETSILNQNIPSIIPVTIQSNLIYSNTIEIEEFNTKSILNLDSKFDDIVELKQTSILDKTLPFEAITDLPYSDVLQLNSRYDDLVIKDINSVLKVYVASKLPDTIPGVANFFDDIHNTGFTLDAQQGQSLFKLDAIPEYRNAKDNPEKSIVDLVPMQITPEKNAVDINLARQTPEKTGLDISFISNNPEKTVVDVNVMPDTIEKTISDINPPAITAEKLPANLIPIGETPEKVGVDVNLLSETPEKTITALRELIGVPKEGRDPIPMPPTPEKPIETLSEVDYIPNIDAIGFTREAAPLQTLFTNIRLPIIKTIEETPDKKTQATEPSSVNFFSDDKAVGFTLNNRRLVTEYNLDEIPDLYGFNWNIPPGYPGVLNQYAVYFSKYTPLTNVTYKTVIDWAYNQTVRVPEAQALYNEGFHTPKVPVSEFQLITPPYQYANDRLPGWANTYTNTLVDMGSTLVAGYLSQKTIELVASTLGVDAEFQNRVTTDSSPLIQSQLVFQQLAGEIYWKKNELGTVVRNIREGILNFTSDLVGRQLADIFIPKVESAIGNAASNLINSIFDAPLLNGDKVLMMYHIMMGTKYTKSKAFFDRLTKIYSSKYGQIGDNAVNMFNDQNTYKKYADGNSLDAFGYSIPYIPISLPSQISTTIDNLTGLSTTQVMGQSEQDNSISVLKSTLYKAVNAPNNSLIPFGQYQPGLINKYLWKEDSWTFGQQVEPEKYYSDNAPLEQRVHQYDEAVLFTSIDKNYPTDKQIADNPSLKVKTDLNALVSNNISEYTNILSSDLYIAKNNISHKSTKDITYYSLLKDRLNGKGKLLDDKGFPSIATQFSDSKNRLNMIKMPADKENRIGTAEYEDNDLIDFYFEDLSSLSRTNESVVIPFRAILTTISDGTNANWAAQDYMGRADKFWIYQGFERRVALQFEVAINSKDEFISSWNKINYLHGMCYPVEYPAQIALKAPIMALTIGNLFNRVQVILNSFNVSFDGSTLWEIEKGYQLPLYIKIQTDFTVIFADTPLASRKHYAQGIDSNWITPKIYNYSKAGNIQSIEDLNDLKTDENGNLSISTKNEQYNSNLQQLGIAPNLGVVNTFGGTG